MNQELGRKIPKLLESRSCLEIELLKVHKYIEEAIENKNKKVLVKNYIKKANIFPEKVFLKWLSKSNGGQRYFLRGFGTVPWPGDETTRWANIESWELCRIWRTSKFCFIAFGECGFFESFGEALMFKSVHISSQRKTVRMTWSQRKKSWCQQSWK